MKKIIIYSYFLISLSITSFSQSSSELLIDNVSTIFTDISFPYWLKSGQTINIGSNTKSISILEFIIDNNTLEFSQVLSVSGSQSVPNNKVWKIESVGFNNPNSNSTLPNTSTRIGSITSASSQIPTIYQSPKKFEQPGNYNWVAPPGVSSICVEVWGGGGNGFFSSNGLNGGGGGGYGYKCFNISQGTSYTVVVGNYGEDSSFGSFIIATAGGNAGVSNVGTGGSASSTIGDIFVIRGTSGAPNLLHDTGFSAYGGTGGNGGAGANPCGPYPPGGGGGSCNTGNQAGAKIGARGQVYIHW